MKKIKALIKLMRPKHWAKNFLIFIPLFCSMEFRNADSVLKVLEGLLAFSFISSVIYIINDIFDVEKDKKHPTKCNRPLASGEVKKMEAGLLAGVLFVGALLMNELIFSASIIDGIIAILTLMAYFLINLVYSFKGKQVPILYVTLLASGFVIRVIYGCVIIDVSLSHWLYLTILAFAYYMGLGKRRGEMQVNGSSSRDVLKYYTMNFLNKNMQIFMALTLVFYSLWTIDEKTVERVGNSFLIWSVPLVIVICLKYSLNIERDDELADPMEVLFKDKVLIFLGILFVIFMLTIFCLG